METRLARADGAPVPRIVVGTSSLGSVLPDALVSAGARDAVFRYLDGALEVGCFALDVAASYQVGGTERVIGRWIAARGNRDRLYLVTKGGHPFPVVEPHRLSPKALAADLEASLRRLRTDRIDLYLLHRDDPTTPLESIAQTMASFQRRGEIRAWGVSNWTHERIRALDAVARAQGGPPIAASSPHFSLAEWVRVPWKGCVSIAGASGGDARSFYASSQMPVLAWSPLGRGFFSAGPPPAGGVYGCPLNAERRRRAQRLAAERGVSAAQIALAYLVSQPFPVYAVVATSSAERLKDNLRGAEIRLTAEEIASLDGSGGQDDRTVHAP
jgi:aryl-alcohol dehydrogenase-like predicted oxidoreductase